MAKHRVHEKTLYANRMPDPSNHLIAWRERCITDSAVYHEAMMRYYANQAKRAFEAARAAWADVANGAGIGRAA